MAAAAAKGALAPVLGRRDYGTYGPRQATSPQPKAPHPKSAVPQQSKQCCKGARLTESRWWLLEKVCRLLGTCYGTGIPKLDRKEKPVVRSLLLRNQDI